ncbi:MAG: carotenoid biosynthesis protein [Methanomicrobiales archaeon]|nr:carotenoid biosynthesis protein [Methanomicrobiales archaeon]
MTLCLSVHTMELFPETLPARNRAVIAAGVLSIAVFVSIMLSADLLPLLGVHLPQLPAQAYVKMGSATLAAFFCFWYFRGLQNALIGLIGISALFWVLEFLSGHLGMFGGTYSYTDAFPGPSIGGTPVFLGLEHYAYYFFMSYFIANLLVDGVIVSSQESWWKRALFVSFISSTIVMGIDMMADPVQVNAFQQWHWAGGSPYFGIPYGNYAGYILIYTLVLFAFKYLEFRFHAQEIGTPVLAIACVPLIMHFSRFLEYASTELPGLTIVGCFTMLLPCILAGDRLFTYFRKLPPKA